MYSLDVDELVKVKFVDQFTHLGRNISSTERYINKRIGKTWTI